MERENLVKECDRLLTKLSGLDPTTAEYRQVKELLFGSGGKGGSQGLFGALLQMDNSAQDLIDRDKKMDLEFKKYELEQMKLALDEMKFEQDRIRQGNQDKIEREKLDLEREKIKVEKESSARKLDIEEQKAETEAKEAEDRMHYTKREARAWRERTLLQTACTAGLIWLVKDSEKASILSKTAMSFIPKAKGF